MDEKNNKKENLDSLVSVVFVKRVLDYLEDNDRESVTLLDDVVKKVLPIFKSKKELVSEFRFLKNISLEGLYKKFSLKMDDRSEVKRMKSKFDKKEEKKVDVNESSKYDRIDFKPPESVAKEAEKGLEYRKKAGGKGGLDNKQASEEGIGSGVQRAVNLKNRDTISPDTIKRMVSFFARHEKNKSIDPKFKNEPWKDRGYVAWLIWGGDSGKQWANKINNQIKKVDNMNEKVTTADIATHVKKVGFKDYVNKRKKKEMDESTSLIDSFVKKTGKSKKEVEGKWDEAKGIVSGKYKDIKKGTDEFFKLTVGVLKNLLGIKDKEG